MATVAPLLKKPSLDTSDLNNFHPISVVPFISKILEKAVFCQLQLFLNKNHISEVFQSGFKPFHSTESALLRVFNDIYTTTDAGDSVILLDLSAAFDTVDHTLLLSRLQSHVGIKGSVLNWFKSFLSERHFSVRIGNCTSSAAPLISGIPQGSILSPSLFSLYLLPLGSILRKFGVSFHFYADDSQIYLQIKRNDPSTLLTLLSCLDEVKFWLSNNFLTLNDSKNEIIFFGPSDKTEFNNSVLGNLSVFNSNCVRNLGVLIDSRLTLDKHVSSVIASSLFQLHSLSKIKHFCLKNLVRQLSTLL